MGTSQFRLLLKSRKIQYRSSQDSQLRSIWRERDSALLEASGDRFLGFIESNFANLFHRTPIEHFNIHVRGEARSHWESGTPVLTCGIRKPGRMCCSAKL